MANNLIPQAMLENLWEQLRSTEDVNTHLGELDLGIRVEIVPNAENTSNDLRAFHKGKHDMMQIASRVRRMMTRARAIWGKSLRFKLIIAVLTVLIPVLIFSAALVRQSFTTAIEDRIRVDTDIAERNAVAFRNYLDVVWATERAILSYRSPGQTRRPVVRPCWSLMGFVKTAVSLVLLSP